jgi:hypothetical protein
MRCIASRSASSSEPAQMNSGLPKIGSPWVKRAHKHKRIRQTGVNCYLILPMDNHWAATEICCTLFRLIRKFLQERE